MISAAPSPPLSVGWPVAACATPAPADERACALTDTGDITASSVAIQTNLQANFEVTCNFDVVFILAPSESFLISEPRSSSWARRTSAWERPNRADLGRHHVITTVLRGRTTPMARPAPWRADAEPAALLEPARMRVAEGGARR